MNIQPNELHRESFSIIGFSQIFQTNEGYAKCPQFWDEMFAKRFVKLFQCGKPETPEEQAVIDNCIGEFALCRMLPGCKEFEYMIGGTYRGCAVPDSMKLFTLPESDWLEFKTHGPLPSSLQSLNSYIWEVWMPAHKEQYTQRDGIDLECYSAGNPNSPDYECGICVPIRSS